MKIFDVPDIIGQTVALLIVMAFVNANSNRLNDF
jgi:hypothetical protein